MRLTTGSDGPDRAAMRLDRRRRVLEAMAAHGVNVLVLGRPSEVAFATGARQLWTAGSRPFGPAAIVVGDTGRTHLLATSDDGVPPEVGPDDLLGPTWNPANLAKALAEVPGLAKAGRLATTSSTPGFGRLLGAIAPDAEVVDGGPVIAGARAVKSADELACITEATAVAEEALAAMVDALAPGVSERDLLGVYLQRLGELGTPTPPTEGVVCATATKGPVRLRHLANERPIEEGQAVVFDVSADVAGYEGGLSRTFVAGRRQPGADRRTGELAHRCRAALDLTKDACRHGATGADVRRAATATGEPLPDVPIVVGVGVGVEPPVVAAGIGDGAVLRRGMVLAVSSWVAQEGTGGWFERDLVVVGDGAPQVIRGGRP